MNKDLIENLSETNKKLDSLTNENLEMKRLLLTLFNKAYDLKEEEGISSIAEYAEAGKTDEENKNKMEKQNAIINFINKIKKELE